MLFPHQPAGGEVVLVVVVGQLVVVVFLETLKSYLLVMPWLKLSAGEFCYFSTGQQVWD